MGAGALSLSTTYKANRVVNTSVTITLIIVRSTWRFFDAPVRSHPRQPHSWQRYVLCEVNRLTSFSRKPRVWDLRVFAPHRGHSIEDTVCQRENASAFCFAEAFRQGIVIPSSGTMNYRTGLLGVTPSSAPTAMPIATAAPTPISASKPSNPPLT